MDKKTLQMIVFILETRQKDAGVLKENVEILHLRIDNLQSILSTILEDSIDNEKRELAALLEASKLGADIKSKFQKEDHKTDQLEAVIAALKELANRME